MSATQASPKVLRHPAGLKTLFYTEMWERFSFYGMRALLVLYLVDHLKYERAEALKLYATYTALVYLTPLIGGWLADRYLGQRRAVLIGGVLMALGHFAMAVESLLVPALGLLIAGNGFFKPNISTMVGELYEKNDPRRDGAFTLFYMGINLGAFFSPIVCGTLGQKVGWHAGFAAAGVGMIVSLLWFHWRLETLAGAGLPPGQRQSGVGTGHADAVNTAAGVSGDFPGIGMCLIATLAMFLFVIGFEQAGGTLNLFAEQRTQLSVFGFDFPSSWFQSVNPVMILGLAPIFDRLWLRVQVGTALKQGLGLALLGIGFWIMSFADAAFSVSGPVSPVWLIGVYFFCTASELCISPVGLSVVSRNAPAGLVGFMMAVFFFAVFAGNYLAGTLEARLSAYGIGLWDFLTWFPLLCGVIWLMAAFPLRCKFRAG